MSDQAGWVLPGIVAAVYAGWGVCWLARRWRS